METENNNLTLNDVILMSNIITTVSRRGGFEANEFTVVGKLHEKLVALIPAPEENTVAQESPTETTNVSTDDSDQLKFEFVQDKDDSQ
jgi:hypothetical protein